MNNSTSIDKKNYYLEYMKIYLQTDETPDNFLKILNDYENAYNIRKAKIDNLYSEVKIIKKLKV